MGLGLAGLSLTRFGLREAQAITNGQLDGNAHPNVGGFVWLKNMLEKFHREHPEIEVVTISKGEPKENPAKVKEHGLTFAVILQRQWEISRLYAMFATPVAYLIDGSGLIAAGPAVGVEPIMALMAKPRQRTNWCMQAEQGCKRRRKEKRLNANKR